MIHEFAEPIPIVTPLGTGRALFVESTAHDNWWTVALDSTQALVTFPQAKLRIARSYSLEQGIGDREMRKIVRKHG